MKKLKFIATIVALLCAGLYGAYYYLLPKGEKIVSIEGELTNVPNGLEVKLVWYSFRQYHEVIDTVQNGHFSFNCDGSDDKGIYHLFLETLNATNGTKKDITLYLSKNIKITGQGDNILTWNVESDNSRQIFYNKMNNISSDEYAKIEKENEALATASQAEKDSINAIIDSLKIAINDKQLTEMMDMSINEDWEYQLLDISKSLVADENHPLREKVAKAYNILPNKRKNKNIGQSILKYLQSVGIGGDYINLQLADINEEQHTISEYVGSKWLLLDFSDYYCGYCHALCPTLKYLHKTYGDGLQLVTISNDEKKDFAKMVEEDEIIWPAFYNQEAYSKYGINGRPTFILISPEGKIVDRCQGANVNWLFKTFLKHSENTKPTIEQIDDATVIKYPLFDTDFKGLLIEKITMYPDSTILSFVSLSLSNYSIGSGSILRCSDGSVCKATNSTIGFNNYVSSKQCIKADVTFEALPKGIESFDYIEGECASCFSVKGVKMLGN